MRIHFIAIGGAAMHNLALALHEKGYLISGSDDEIFEPSRSRLEKAGLLPKSFGWFPENLSTELDAVILGMHARPDNPELIKAQELNLKVYSYPEFLYEQTKTKKRVVIGGSHGKTTITSMIMHVLRECNMDFDYMVGAQIEGFETMVSLSEKTDIAIFEGDEYLSSPIDPRPKFHLYKPDLALLSGIGWDHINVFPTFDNYIEQFKIFIDLIMPNGNLFYYEGDPELNKLADNCSRNDLNIKKYKEAEHFIKDSTCYLKDESNTPLRVFGNHNMQNLSGAKEVCKVLGITESKFNKAISSFQGSAKRLQNLYKDETTTIFLDFAHSPSKVTGTIDAVKKQYPKSEIIAVYELHTFSSLNKKFLSEYKGTIDKADKAIVFFNPSVLKHKNLPELTKNEVKEAFAKSDAIIQTATEDLIASILKQKKNTKQVFLLMSSGNFGGINMEDLVSMITKSK